MAVAVSMHIVYMHVGICVACVIVYLKFLEARPVLLTPAFLGTAWGCMDSVLGQEACWLSACLHWHSQPPGSSY